MSKSKDHTRFDRLERKASAARKVSRYHYDCEEADGDMYAARMEGRHVSVREHVAAQAQHTQY